MSRRLITAIIAVAFLMESTGIGFSSPAARTKEHTLRPTAEAVSDSIDDSLSLKMSSSGFRADLSEGQKMETQRLDKKNWTRKQCVEALEKAGFEFSTDSPRAKGLIVFYLERGKKVPTDKEAAIIQKVFGDKTLFKKVTKEQVAPADLSEGQKVEWHRVNKNRWTRKLCVEALEKAGFKFTSSSLESKIVALSNIEGDKKLPIFKEAVIIRKVFGDKTLFEKVTKKQVAPADLSDGQKMKWLRVNTKRWTRKQCGEALEEAGFEFTSSSLESKIAVLFTIEEDKKPPTFKEAVIIRRVFGDKTLFEKVTKEKEKVQEVAPADLSDGQKVEWYRVNKKRWSRARCIEALEEAGFGFSADSINGKMAVLFNLERKKRTPSPDEVVVIRRVFGDSTLFKEVIPAHLPEGERMERQRLHKKGWTRKQCAEALEKAGFKFSSNTIRAKTSLLYSLEKGIRPPTPAEAAIIRTVFGDETLFVAELPAKDREPSRTERLNLILEEDPKLDTPKKLLEYINGNDLDLLDGISERKQLKFLRDFIFLRYETIPLSGKALKRLPGITSEGARLDVIREGRGIEVEKLCKLADISKNVYVDMVKRKVFSRPEKVIKVLKALQVDAIYIKKGKGWDKVAPDMEDKDKMFLCRFRKGWTQRDFIAELEKAGLKFESNKIRSKEKIVTNWEKDGQIPKPEERKIIREVLGESSLYEKADEIEQAGLEGEGPVFKPSEEGAPKYLHGVRPSKIHTFFAEHWQELTGLTTGDIETGYGISSVSTRTFLRNNKGAAEAYGINYPVIGRKPSAKGRPLRGREPLSLFTPARPERRRAITMNEAAEMADRAVERIRAEEAKEEVAKSGKATKKRQIVKARERTAKEMSLKASALSLEAESIVDEADEIYESLKSPRTRGLVEKTEIEEAISKLTDLSYELQSRIEEKVEPEMKPDELLIRKETRRRWMEVKNLLRRLKALVPTELCDWDNPQIRPKAAEITEASTTDSDRKDAIVRWVDRNIELVPEYKGCWKTKASQTPGLLKGTHFNRVNLIVAMLRSIGIPAHYRIINFKKEMAGDKSSTERDETAEHVVAEAVICIEESWNELMAKTIRTYRSVCLEDIDAEKIAEFYRLDNIDEFAREKAREQRQKAQGRADPSQQLRALKAISQSA